MVHLLPHWNWSAGTNVTVYAYTNCDTVELFLNDVNIRSDGKYLVFITADVQDADSSLVPNAESSISFSVTGPGELVGVDNGNPIDTSSYKATSRKAFSGKALAIVRSTGMAGSIVVSASGTGLTSAPVTVQAN